MSEKKLADNTSCLFDNSVVLHSSGGKGVNATCFIIKTMLTPKFGQCVFCPTPLER